MRMRRSDQVLVQQEGDGDELSFGVRRRVCSLITVVLAVLMLVGANAIGEGVRHRGLLVPGFYVFFALFVWSSIYSYFTIKTLRIHGAEKVVKYRKSNFMGTDEWTRAFPDFGEIRISSRGNKSFRRVILGLKDEQEIPLGTSEVGVFGIDRARNMANHIARIMGLAVVEE